MLTQELAESLILAGTVTFRLRFFLGGSAEVEELDSRIAFQLRHRDGLHKEKMAEMQEKYSH